jgi:N-acetylmuramoyl-L-alanine amidase
MYARKLLSIAFSTFVSALSIWEFPLHSAADDTKSQSVLITVNAYHVHIRSGAGTDFPIIGEVDFGSRLPVLSQDRGWFEVTLPNGETGWIAGWLTDSSLTPATLNQTRTDSKETQMQIATAIQDNTNVRSGPSTSYDCIATISPGTSYAVSQISGDWVQIRLPDERSGWVAKWVVSLAVQDAKRVADTEAGHATIIGTNVPLHERPKSDSNVLAQLQQGTIVQRLGIQDGWTQIQSGNLTGWVASDAIQTQQDTPKILPGPISPQSASRNGTVTPSGTDINIRLGPGLNYAILGKADPNTSYPVLGQSGQWFRIRLQNGKEAWIASWVVQTNGLNQQKEPDKSVTSPSIDQILRGKTIVIDPGHGGIDVGAIGRTTGMFEKDLTLATSKLLFNKLQETGAHVILTRTDDTYVSLGQRVEIAKQAHADAFVSIHENTNSDPSIAGTISYFYDAHGEDAKLADAIEQSIDGGIAHPEIGTQFGDFYVLRENPQLAVLVECAFLSNAGDELLAESPNFQERIADGILKGLIQYFQDQVSSHDHTPQ